ncbi:hypothetical protein QBC41DRAFT_332445, partial [Cercophora samala]
MGGGGAEGVWRADGNGGHVNADLEASLMTSTDYTSFDFDIELSESQAAEVAVMLEQLHYTTDSQSMSTSPSLSNAASTFTTSMSDESTSQETATPKERHPPQQSRCSKCTTATKQHKRYHDKRFECPKLDCNMRFSLRLDLKRHLETVKHGGKRTFPCQWCVKRFTRKDNYQRHLKDIHGGG